MTTSDMIRELCDRMNISLAELCRRIGQTAEVLDVGYEQAFVLPDGEKIGKMQ